MAKDRRPADLIQWARAHGVNPTLRHLLANRLDDPRYRALLTERDNRVIQQKLLELAGPPQKPKRKRAPGGGAKQKLMPEEKIRLQGIYRRAIRRDPAYLKGDSAIEMLREYTSVSPSTRMRHIIRPVWAEAGKSPRKSK